MLPHSLDDLNIFLKEYGQAYVQAYYLFAQLVPFVLLHHFWSFWAAECVTDRDES
jgi:hypothetical protein